MADDTEGARRLRAALRALLSRGVWLAVGAQVMLSMAAAAPIASESPVQLVRLVAGGLALFGLLYLIAGTSHAAARGRDPITVRAALQSGIEVFLPFLWLVFKTVLLAALILQIVMSAAVVLSGREPAALLEQSAPYLGFTMAALGFALAYWMPIVFVQRNFGLFRTLGQALRIAWDRLRVSSYLAFLTFTPAVLTMLLDADATTWAIAAANLVASVLSWIAYIYCVEWCQTQHAPAAQLS